MELIDEIRKPVREDKIIISKHANMGMVERDVLANDLSNLILNGEIIEHYPDDFPCLFSAHVRFPAGENVPCCCGKIPGRSEMPSSNRLSVGRPMKKFE